MKKRKLNVLKVSRLTIIMVRSALTALLAVINVHLCF